MDTSQIWTPDDPAQVDYRALARSCANQKKQIRLGSAAVAAAVADPLIWLQGHTRTLDRHWREAGYDGPYQPFPQKPYFRHIIDTFEANTVVFVEKSRDMMLSWGAVGYLTHCAMTVPGREILLQSQKEQKAFELVDYAKTLYDQQDQSLKDRFPVTKPVWDQADGWLEFAHDSRIIGIPQGADQIRSYHPWALLLDEAAFQEQAGEAYEAAIAACYKILVVSSAGPSWFADVVQGNVA